MPRFTQLQTQLKHLCCGYDLTKYKKFLIPPTSQIDHSLIVSEQAHMDQIVATLGLKEMTQSTLIRKLCALPQQNRIESYHQLRAFIAQTSGKKELIGRTDLDVEISNQCGRLIANVVIAYNSIMLSMLLDKYKAAGSEKVIALFQKISPVAWQHIHFLGHYAFRDNKHIIDLEIMLANITLE